MLNVELKKKKKAWKWDITNRVALAAQDSFFLQQLLWEDSFSWGCQNVPQYNTCCFVLIHAPSGRLLKSNGKESILFCWLMRTIDWAVLVRVLTFAFNHLIRFPRWAMFTWDRGDAHKHGNAFSKKPIRALHLRLDLDNQWPRNWSARAYCGERWHHPDVHRPAANLSAF